MFTIPRQQVIFGRSGSKYIYIYNIVTSRGISFRSSSNNTPSSPSYSVGIKIGGLPEENSNEEFSAGIGDDYYYSPLDFGDDLKKGDMSGANFSLNNHTLFLNSILISIMVVRVVDIDFFKPHSLPM